MITPALLSDLRTIMRILKEQATKYVAETTNKTTLGRFMIARLDTLNRIDVYITAASPGDSIGELRDSIGMIRDERLAEIDGSEEVERLPST